MKALFILASFFAMSTSFAQQDMFWNNYSNINPAMSGFQYQQHGAVSYSDYLRSYSPKNLQANYNIRLGDKHGLGLNFTGHNFALNQSNAMLNYNYQFKIGKEGRLSAGIGAGLSHLRQNPSYSILNSYDIRPTTYFQMNLGVAYKRKQLTVGASMRNVTQPTLELDSGLIVHTRPSFTLHAEYDFRIGENFQLTPRVMYGPLNNTNLSYPGRLNLDLTLQYKNKFSLGAMYNFNGGIGLHAGWDINEKFRIAYMFNSRFSNLNSGPINAQHQITFGFKIP